MLRKAGWRQHEFTDPQAFAALYSGDEDAAKAKDFAILNARYHEQEAEIIAQAGVPGAVTIATNMAGRGTDIQLGGNLDMRVRQELKDVEGVERATCASPKSRCRSPSSRRRRSPPAVSSCSAPSGTKAAASTTSCAAVPAARATPAIPSSSCRSKTI